MTRTKLKQSGFTTIEMVLVLIIIAVLSGLILVTHQGITKQNQDTTRKNDIDALRVALETYNSQNNKYPTLAQVNDPSWRATNMKDLQANILHDPQSKSYLLASQPAKKVYAYHVAAVNGRACDDVHVICTQYTLTATLAGGGTYVEHSLE